MHGAAHRAIDDHVVGMDLALNRGAFRDDQNAGLSGLARMSPKISPSTRKPSVKVRLPSMRLPWAIRLLIGGCAFCQTCGLLNEGLQLDALDRTGDCAFHHLGGHSFYHGLGGQVDHAFNAPVLPELQRLTTARQGQRPGLGPSVPVSVSSSLPLNSGAPLAGLHHQYLPAQLVVANHLGLQTADRATPSGPLKGSVFQKSPDRRAGHGCRFRAGESAQPASPARALGGQQAARGVGHRLRLVTLFAQLGHFGAQLHQFFLAGRVQARNVLAELEGPQAMAAQKPSTIAMIAQRNGQGMALRTAMRGALMVRRRRSRRKRMGKRMMPQTTKPQQVLNLCGFGPGAVKN
jgi:hypothetical protein